MITRRRLVISLILAGCVALMGWGFTLVRPTNQPIVIKDSAVKALIPAPGDRVLRQAFISATLAQDYTLAYDTSPGFAVAAVGIPQDQLQIVPGLNQYFFYPGPGKELTELPSGRVCVSLRLKRVLIPTDPGRPFGWCFFTH